MANIGSLPFSAPSVASSPQDVIASGSLWVKTDAEGAVLVDGGTFQMETTSDTPEVQIMGALQEEHAVKVYDQMSPIAPTIAWVCQGTYTKVPEVLEDADPDSSRCPDESEDDTTPRGRYFQVAWVCRSMSSV